MNIVQIAPIFKNRIHGVKNSVTSFSSNLNKIDKINCSIYSIFIDTDFKYKGQLISPVKKIDFKSTDLIIFSGLYNIRFIWCYIMILRYKVPYIVTPRSSLMKKSLNKSSIKKRLFLFFFGNFFLKSAKAIQFLTDEEKQNSFNYNKNCFILGNGIEQSSEIPDKKIFFKKISFIGRMDIYHKGLDRLLSAVNNCKDKLTKSGWKIYLYGPVRKKDKIWIYKYIQKNNLNKLLVLGEAVDDEERRNIYLNSDIFIHTSRYEGQPQSVLEALYNKVPVAVTEGTNMSKIVKKYSLGWCIENNYLGIESFINDLEKINILEIEAYSKNCREYVINHCNWDIIANKFLKIIQTDYLINMDEY